MEKDKPIVMKTYFKIISEVGFMLLLRKGGAIAISVLIDHLPRRETLSISEQKINAIFSHIKI